MPEAESAIKALLEASSGALSSATAVWAVLAPPAAVKPYAVFEVDSEQLNEVMGSSTTPTTCWFTVRIFADTLAEIVAAHRAIKDGMSRYSGTIGGVTVQALFYEGRSDEYDESDREYSRALDFRMFYEE